MANRIQQAIEPWFKRRAPAGVEATLTLRNIYIFFSKEGLMYGLLLLVTFVAGVNYGNNLVLGMCFLLASLLVVTIHYTFAHLANLHIKLLDISDTQVGGKVLVRLQVSSSARQPHRQIRFSFFKHAFIQQPLQAENTLPIAADGQEAVTIVPQISTPQVVHLWLDAKQRGKLVLPRLTVSTVYPLGILQAWSYVFLDAVAWVYPAPLAYEGVAEQYAVSMQDAPASLQTQAGQEDFDQLDSFVMGESLARVSWAHLARGQGLLSKRFVDEVGQQQVLDYYQMPATTHEDRLSQLRYGVDKLAERQVAFRLILPDGEGVMGQGSAFVQQSLLRLAKTP